MKPKGLVARGCLVFQSLLVADVQDSGNVPQRNGEMGQTLKEKKYIKSNLSTFHIFRGLSSRVYAISLWKPALSVLEPGEPTGDSLPEWTKTPLVRLALISGTILIRLYTECSSLFGLTIL